MHAQKGIPGTMKKLQIDLVSILVLALIITGAILIWGEYAGIMRNINRVADQGFTPFAIDRINKLVNGGSFGYYERFAYSHYTRNILTDWIAPDSTVTIATPRGGVNVRVDLSRPE
jgi:hypothetical protein